MNTGQKTIGGLLIVVAGLLVVNLSMEVSGGGSPYDPLAFDSWTPDQYDPWAGFESVSAIERARAESDQAFLLQQQLREMRNLRRSNERIARENRRSADLRQSYRTVWPAAPDQHAAGCKCSRCRPDLYGRRTASLGPDPNPFATAVPTSNAPVDLLVEVRAKRAKEEARMVALENSVKGLRATIVAQREIIRSQMDRLIWRAALEDEVRNAQHDAVMQVIGEFTDRLENVALMVRHAHADDEQQTD